MYKTKIYVLWTLAVILSLFLIVFVVRMFAVESTCKELGYSLWKVGLDGKEYCISRSETVMPLGDLYKK